MRSFLINIFELIAICTENSYYPESEDTTDYKKSFFHKISIIKIIGVIEPTFFTIK